MHSTHFFVCFVVVFPAIFLFIYLYIYDVMFFLFTKKKELKTIVIMCVSLLLLVLFFCIKFIVYNFCTHAQTFIIVTWVGHRFCNTMPFCEQFLRMSFSAQFVGFYVLFLFFFYSIILSICGKSSDLCVCICAVCTHVVFPLILIEA